MITSLEYDFSDLGVDENRIGRVLAERDGYPHHEFSGLITELLNNASRVCTVKAEYRVFPVGEWNDEEKKSEKRIMFMHILNYTVRGAIVLIGVLLLTGVLFPKNADATLMRVFGVVFILFGVYRIAMYYMQVKKYNFQITNEEDDDESED